MALDLSAARAHFPALNAPGLADQVHFENAGGSWPCLQSIEALESFYRDCKLQPYGAGAPSMEAGRRMESAHARWAEATNAELALFGPSTSQNTYVLAHAFGAMVGPGDEVIVTNQDHEANGGVWRRMAEARGATLREWRLDAQSGALDPAEFHRLLSERTRLVCFPHCSNIVGQANPVAELTAAARQAGAWSVVDGVSWAPHEMPDMEALGADIYLFSLYKVYGVHQGLMLARRAVAEVLPNQAHFFNDGIAHKRLVPAGPDHAQVGASTGVLDYVDALAAHHGITGDAASRARGVSALWRAHENALADPFLEYLSSHPRARLIGAATVSDGRRAPTIALDTTRAPAEVASALAERGVIAGAGHFYAWRVLEALGLDPARGVLRLSFVHYTAMEDIERLVGALEDVL